MSQLIVFFVFLSIIISYAKRVSQKNVTKPNVPRVQNKEEIKTLNEIYGTEKNAGTQKPYSALEQSIFESSAFGQSTYTQTSSNQSSYGQTTRSQSNYSQPNYGGKSNYGQSAPKKDKEASSTSKTASAKAAAKKSSTDPKSSVKTTNQTREDVQAKTAGKQDKSTTQYLQEKARHDSHEHAVEKRKEELENRKLYGNIRYAQRLILGDSVPKGMKMVYCTYCGAENLVPIHEGKEKYNCYFCREKL